MGEKSKTIVEMIKKCLAEEEERRKKGIVRGFAGALKAASILQSSADRKKFDFSSIGKTAKLTVSNTMEVEEVPCVVNKPVDDVVEIVPETMEAMESDSDESGSDLEITAEKSKEQVMNEKIKEHIDLDDDSEEEETQMLTSV